MDNGTGMIQLNTTGTTFQKKERRWAHGVHPSSEHCCSLLNEFGVTTKYCNLRRDHVPRAVSAKDMDMKWGCVHGT